MKKLESLTPEQASRLAPIRDAALRFALGGDDENDEAKFHAGIDFMYGLAKINSPIKVYVDSPLAGSGLLDDPPDTIGKALLADHATFRTTRIGFVTVYDRVTPARPPAFCR